MEKTTTRTVPERLFINMNVNDIRNIKTRNAQKKWKRERERERERKKMSRSAIHHMLVWISVTFHDLNMNDLTLNLLMPSH